MWILQLVLRTKQSKAKDKNDIIVIVQSECTLSRNSLTSSKKCESSELPTGWNSCSYKHTQSRFQESNLYNSDPKRLRHIIFELLQCTIVLCSWCEIKIREISKSLKALVIKMLQNQQEQKTLKGYKSVYFLCLRIYKRVTLKGS